MDVYVRPQWEGFVGLLRGARTKRCLEPLPWLNLVPVPVCAYRQLCLFKHELCSVSPRHLSVEFASLCSSPVLYISMSVYAVLRFIYVHECVERRVYFCTIFSWYCSQGSHKPGKSGIVREFCKPGKVREFEIWSGIFYDMSHFWNVTGVGEAGAGREKRWYRCHSKIC